MRRFVSTLALGATISIAALLGLTASAEAITTTSPYVIVYQHGVGNVNTETSTLEAQYGFTATFVYAKALKGFAASLTSTQLSGLSANSAIDYIAPDTTFTATGLVPLAPGETLPIGIERIGAATTTQVHGPSGVSIAVLDSGIDLANSDLNAVSGINCIKSGRSAQDDNGHGTNVAGIIAAKNQGAGVVGVAPGTKLYAVKVLGSTGSGTLSQILCGVNWVTANAAALNIKVANMSLIGAGQNDNNCGNTNKDAEHQAICNSTKAGVSYITAAGNNSASFANYTPAVYPEVLTVTAMSDTDGTPGATGPVPTCVSGQKDDSYATYSNYAVATNDQAHTIAAPGTCVISDQLGGGRSTYYGTSQAAPHAAGTVALCVNDGGVAGPCSGLTPAQIIAKVRNDASTAATSSTGFTGDPFHPITGRYYGNLITAAPY
jgi:subtilisin